MRARNVARLRIVAGVTVVAAALGAALSVQDSPVLIAGNAFASGLIGLTLAAIEIGLQGPARASLQRVPVGLVFLSRIIVYSAVIAGAPEIAGAAASLLSPAPELKAGLGIGPAKAIAISIGFNAFSSPAR